MNLSIVFAAVCCLLSITTDITAQEVLIPMDEDSRVDMISPEMRYELNLFPEIRNFRSARLFRSSDSAYILVIESNSDSGIVRQRTILASGEMLDMRQHITKKLRTSDPGQYLKREGRVGLVTGITTLSLGFYGWAMPEIVDSKNERQSTGLYLLTAGAGFLVPYIVTGNMDVTNGMTTLGLHGGLRGIGDGAILYWLFKGDGDDWDDQAMFSAMMATSIAELIAGTSIASATNMTDGTASALSTMGLFGAGVGFATYGIVGDEDNASGPLLALSGSALGYVAGIAMSNNQRYTAGDAQVLGISGMNAVALAEAVTMAFGPDDDKVYYASAIASAVAGLILGNELVRDKDFSSTEALFVGFGTTGGYFIGSALGLMGGTKDGKVVAVASAIGGSIGFGLMLNRFSGSARKRMRASEHASSWDFQISPVGLAAAVGVTGGSSMPLPVASISYHW